METDQVQKIKFCKDTIKKLLAEIEPMNEEEWDVFETLTSVHKALRKIDLGKISQPQLPGMSPKSDGKQIELPDPRATVISGEDSLVEHPLIEGEDKPKPNPKLTLRIVTPEPGDEVNDYQVFIGENQTVGFTLKAAITAALIPFDDKIPEALSDDDKKMLRAILDANPAEIDHTHDELEEGLNQEGLTLTGNQEAPPKRRRSKKEKTEE